LKDLKITEKSCWFNNISFMNRQKKDNKMAEVVLKNVSKVYESKNQAVEDVSFTIKDKEFVVLVGPSGCGKTTTLRMIAGLEEISEGEIYIDNKLVNDMPPKNRDIAMVFQNYALYPHMTVFENMAFGLKLRKFDRDEIKKRVNEAAKILGLEDYLDRKPKALSGGQRQRVAVGRAIVRKPKVFLFDEPLSNLDAKLRVQMRTEISRLHNNLGATMIYVTHDQTEAMTMGDKIVVMKDGIVQQVDTPMNLYKKPQNKFVAGFIGSPSMNFINGKITNIGNFKSESGDLEFELSKDKLSFFRNYQDKLITIGIRPEDFSLEKTVDEILVSVTIELVEPMGNENFLYFRLNGKQLIARLKPVDFLKVAEKLTLYLKKDKIFYFDDQLGNNLNL
jgi:multiple sugar transport system ATP-binding protein